MHDGLTSEFVKFPVRLFELLAGTEDPDSALSADNVILCLLDPFSAYFLAVHAREGQSLRSAACKSRVELLLRMAEVCISRIEVGHAAVRRRLFGRSVHTHGYDLERLSAEHVLEKARHRQHLVAWMVGAIGDEQQPTSQLPGGSAPKKRKVLAAGGGGT